MSTAISDLRHLARPSLGQQAVRRVRTLRGFAHAAEDRLLCLILIATMLAPLVEIVLRRFSIAVVGPGVLLPCLVLLLSLAGAAVAARNSRLLSFASLTTLASPRLHRGARIVAGGFAAAVSALLSRAAGEWVAMTRQWGGELAYGIPARSSGAADRNSLRQLEKGCPNIQCRNVATGSLDRPRSTAGRRERARRTRQDEETACDGARDLSRGLRRGASYAAG